MDAWFELSDLVIGAPLDALLVFESVAGKQMIPWTYASFAAGPIRSFLMAHESDYEGDLAALRQRSRAFAELQRLAEEGL